MIQPPVMLSILIPTLFYLTVTIFHIDANPAFSNAVDYLLAYRSDPQRANQIGVTAEQLQDVCQAVTASLEKFERTSALARTMIEKFGETNAASINRILSKPNQSVNKNSNAGKIVIALNEMRAICNHLSPNLHSQPVNQNLQNAVDYLLTLAEDAKQNGYTIRSNSDHVNHFNRAYELADTFSGITKETRPILQQACQAVHSNIRRFDELSPLARIMIERFGTTKTDTIITLLKPNAVANESSNEGKLVLGLYKIDEACEQLFRPVADQNLINAFHSLLEFNPAGDTAQQMNQLHQSYIPSTLEEACKHISENIKQFNAQSPLGEILMETFGNPEVYKVKKCLRKATYTKKGPASASGSLAAELIKMDEVCAWLFPNPNVQSGSHPVATKRRHIK